MDNYPIDRGSIAAAAATLEKEVRDLKAQHDSARSGVRMGQLLVLAGLGGYALSSVPLLLLVGFFGLFVYFGSLYQIAGLEDSLKTSKKQLEDIRKVQQGLF
jgi:hypothetical protein